MSDEHLDIIDTPDGLLTDVQSMIEQTRVGVAQAVSAGMTSLYWRIGKRIQSEILQGQRADYGKEIIATLSQQLVSKFGTGFSAKNLRHMIRFAERFPDREIVSTLWRQLSWSHFKGLIYLDDPFKTEFYAEMCRVERWSVRTLRDKIGSMLYERTAISRKPEEVARAELAQLREDDRLTPTLIFKDPYVLDFLGLNDRYLERDLEDAILREIETFLLELGDGFAFLGRQKRIQIDSDDFYLDLLFYHRRLRRLIAVELKLGDFKAGYKGQMELYLRWLAKHEQQPGEESPLGLILCTGKKEEQIEKLHAAIEISRARLEAKREEREDIKLGREGER